jgi:hypothetical protein
MGASQREMCRVTRPPWAFLFFELHMAGAHLEPRRPRSARREGNRNGAWNVTVTVTLCRHHSISGY